MIIISCVNGLGVAGSGSCSNRDTYNGDTYNGDSTYSSLVVGGDGLFQFDTKMLSKGPVAAVELNGTAIKLLPLKRAPFVAVIDTTGLYTAKLQFRVSGHSSPSVNNKNKSTKRNANKSSKIKLYSPISDFSLTRAAFESNPSAGGSSDDSSAHIYYDICSAQDAVFCCGESGSNNNLGEVAHYRCVWGLNTLED